MFNLYEILRNAQGGQAIDNLAAQFNITAEEADAAVKAIVPALSEGFLKQTQHPLGIGSFIGALGEGQHLAAFTDPAAAQDLAAAQKGGDILSQVLGSDSACEEIALRASSATGISPDILTQMLPVIASMIFGGLTKSMQNQGFGGILGQLANAAGQGGLGPILGQILGGGSAPANSQPQPSPAPGQAAWPGSLGSILGQILGGGRVQRSLRRRRCPGLPQRAGGEASATYWALFWEILPAGRGLAQRRDPPPPAEVRKCPVSMQRPSRRVSRPLPRCCSQEHAAREPGAKRDSDRNQ